MIISKLLGKWCIGPHSIKILSSLSFSLALRKTDSIFPFPFLEVALMGSQGIPKKTGQMEIYSTQHRHFSSVTWIYYPQPIWLGR